MAAAASSSSFMPASKGNGAGTVGHRGGTDGPGAAVVLILDTKGTTMVHHVALIFKSNLIKIRYIYRAKWQGPILVSRSTYVVPQPP